MQCDVGDAGAHQHSIMLLLQRGQVGLGLTQGFFRLGIVRQHRNDLVALNLLTLFDARAWLSGNDLMPSGWSETDWYSWLYHYSPCGALLQFGVGVAAYRLSRLSVARRFATLASELGGLALIAVYLRFAIAPAWHEVRSDRIGLARDRSRPSRRSFGQRDKSAALRPSNYLRRDYFVFTLSVSLRDTIDRAAFAVFRELRADGCILSRRELRGLLRIGDSTGNGYLPAGRGTGQALYPRNGGSLAGYTARIARRRLSSRVKAACYVIARGTVERHRCLVR